MQRRTGQAAGKGRKAPAFGRADRAAFTAYCEALQGARAVLPLRGADAADNIFRASLVSTRTYMKPSLTCRDAQGRALRLYPGFVARADPNAFAWRVGDTHVCGVHLGLANALIEIAAFCFSQRALFRDVGDAASERSPGAIETKVPGFWLHDTAAPAEGSLVERAVAIFPRDPQRLACAIYMTLMMLRFVWFHELYHCLNGHVDYVIDRAITLSLHEVETPGIGARAGRGRGQWRLRCLEYDADHSALWAAMQIQLRGTENVEGIKPIARDLRLRMQLFAAFITGWLFDELGRRGQDKRRGRGGAGTHPGAEARIHNLIRCMANDLIPQAPELAGIQARTLDELAAMEDLIPRWLGGAHLTRLIAEDAVYPGIARAIAQLDRLRPTVRLYGYR